MTAKEYLSQAYRVDRMVNAKLDQVRALRELTTKATTVLSDAPVIKSQNNYHLEDTIIKIVDLEKAVRDDISKLVDLKQEVVSVISGIKNADYQMLLELRYLCFKPWNEIAEDMRYNINSIFKMHRRALDCCQFENRQ